MRRNLLVCVVIGIYNRWKRPLSSSFIVYRIMNYRVFETENIKPEKKMTYFLRKLFEKYLSVVMPANKFVSISYADRQIEST